MTWDSFDSAFCRSCYCYRNCLPFAESPFTCHVSGWFQRDNALPKIHANRRGYSPLIRQLPPIVIRVSEPWCTKYSPMIGIHSRVCKLHCVRKEHAPVCHRASSSLRSRTIWSGCRHIFVNVPSHLLRIWDEFAGKYFQNVNYSE